MIVCLSGRQSLFLVMLQQLRDKLLCVIRNFVILGTSLRELNFGCIRNDALMEYFFLAFLMPEWSPPVQ